MPDDIILRPLGRVSEPSHNVAPQGSLLEADNCVIREAGTVEPVPDLTQLSGSNGPTSRGVWQVSPQFDNGTTPDQLCHISDGDSNQDGVAAVGDINTEIQYTGPDGVAASVEYYAHDSGLTMAPMYIARDNLYVVDKRGVYKWEGTGESALVRVWDEEPPSIVGATSTLGSVSWLSTGNHVAYTAVAVFEDANGLISRGAPSARFRAENVAGADRSVYVICYAAGSLYGHPSFHSVEIYRTSQYASTVALPNSHGLVETFAKADFAATGGNYFASVYDSVEDAARGAAAYTDSSQGDLTAGNVAPPEHLYHASFKGHEFWGNVTERFVWPEVKFATAAAVKVPTSTTYTSGSPVVTVASATNLEVGQLVQSGAFPTTTYVTTIAGTTVTLSENATSSGVNTVTFYAAAYARFSDGSTSRVALEHGNGFDSTLLRKTNVYGSSFADTDATYGTYITFASADRPGRNGTAQLWVNTGAVTTDVASLAVSSGAPTSGGTEPAQSVFKRRLYWSKFQEPEHTTLANYVDVGGAGDIVGLSALQDALIILKTDGVYRLTGSNGNWRIDPVDTSVRIIGGRSTATMDNACYTLGNRGLLRVTSSAVENLTDNVIGDWFTEPESSGSASRLGAVRSYMQANDGYHPVGLFAAADPVNREYVLALDAGTWGGEGWDHPGNDGTQTQLLVFNAQSGAFTTWSLDESGEYGISCLGFADGDYTTSGTPQAPGIVLGRKVSAADSSAALFILDNTRAGRTAGHTDYAQNIRFRVRSEGDPTHIKLWSELAWDVGAADISASGISAVFQAGESGADVTQAISGASSVDEIRIWPPIAVSRSTKLVAGLTGTGITVYGLRLSFQSSGKGAPL